jgi:hypothetical protein
LLTIFFYEGNFEEAFEFARLEGVKPFDLITRLQSILDQAPADFKKLIDDFTRESKEELFDTKDTCIEWSKSNFESLVNGSLGGNLLSKYSMIGRFFVTQETLNFLQIGIESTLKEVDAQTNPSLIQAVMDYLRVIVLHVPFASSLIDTPQWTTNYDIHSWRKDMYKSTLENYKYPQSQTFATVVEPERKAMIENRIKTFGETPTGMGKFTRTMFAQNLRRTLVPQETTLDSLSGVSK